MIFANGEVYNEKSIGPRTEPCGTPNLRPIMSCKRMFREKENRGCALEISIQHFQNHVFMGATDALKMKASMTDFASIWSYID